MSNTLKHLVKSVNSMESILIDVQRRFKEQVFNFILIMQDGVGYVGFNDESGFPSFKDYHNECAEDIVAVKVNKQRLYLCTDAEEIDNEAGWFEAKEWGEYDIQDIFACVKGVWEQSND